MGNPKVTANPSGLKNKDIKAQNDGFGVPPDGRPRHPATILCVDDTESNRYTRGRVLRSEGFEIIEATNGSDALRLAAEEQPSLILLDIQLPDLNGFAVCRRLKSSPRTSHIPVLHISSLGKSDHDYPEALESGAEAYLQEPVEPSVLVAVITALIRAASAEASARKAERDAVDILESVGEAMYLLDQDYRFEYVNAEAERVLGFERAALIGKTRAEVFPDSVGNRADREFQRVMIERTPTSFENFYERWQRWFEVKASPVSGGGIAVYFRDITGRKQAEDERQRLVRDLTERTGELQATLDAAPVGVWLAHDPECRQITGNAYADNAIMHGPRKGNISRSAIPGEAAVSYRVFRNGVELQPEELPAQVAARTGKPVINDELDLVFSDGRTVTLLMGAVPLFDGEGRVRGSVVSGADVTQLRRVEADLQQQRAALEATALFPEQNPQPVLRVEHDGTLRYANPSSSGLLAQWDCGIGQRVPALVSEVVKGALAEGSLTELEVEAAGREYSFLIAPIGTAGYANLYARDVTERKRAEQALRESEEHALRRLSEIEAIYRSAPVGLCVLDTDLRFVRVNTRFAETSGWPADAHIGKTPGELNPDMGPVAEQALRRVLETGEPLFDLEVRGVTAAAPGMSRIWIEQWIPLKDGAGRITGVSISAEEVTQRKRAEQVLRESEERLRLAQTAAKVGIWDWDMRSGEVRWTPELEQIYGLEPGSVRAYEDFSRRVHPGDLAAAEASWKEAVTQHRLFEIEFRILQPGGKLVWVHSRGAATYDERGAAIRLFGANIDITERKQAEEVLRESEEQFRTLANAIPQLCWMANEDGWIFWYNQRWYEYTGTTPEQMEGWGWQSVHDPEVLPKVLERWKGSIAAGEPFDMVFPLRGADGVYRPFLTRVMPLRGQDGRVTRWFGTNTDISEQRKTEKALRESEERLRLAQDAAGIGTFEWNIQTGVNTWSPKLEQLYGLPVGSFGRTQTAWENLVHPEDRAGAVELVNEAFESGEPDRGRMASGLARWKCPLAGRALASFQGRKRHAVADDRRQPRYHTSASRPRNGSGMRRSSKASACWPAASPMISTISWSE